MRVYLESISHIQFNFMFTILLCYTSTNKQNKKQKISKMNISHWIKICSTVLKLFFNLKLIIFLFFYFFIILVHKYFLFILADYYYYNFLCGKENWKTLVNKHIYIQSKRLSYKLNVQTFCVPNRNCNYRWRFGFVLYVQ